MRQLHIMEVLKTLQIYNLVVEEKGKQHTGLYGNILADYCVEGGIVHECVKKRCHQS